MGTASCIKTDGKLKPFRLGIFYGTGAPLSFLTQLYSPKWILPTYCVLSVDEVKTNALRLHKFVMQPL